MHLRNRTEIALAVKAAKALGYKVTASAVGRRAYVPLLVIAVAGDDRQAQAKLEEGITTAVTLHRNGGTY
jgi:hypothetical protein